MGDWNGAWKLEGGGCGVLSWGVGGASPEANPATEPPAEPAGGSEDVSGSPRSMVSSGAAVGRVAPGASAVNVGTSGK